MKSVFEFIKSLQFIFKPSHWIRNRSTSLAVDEMINKIICKDLVKSFNEYEAKTSNGLTVWISNYPYSYATIAGYNGMPSRSTVQKFGRYMEKKKYDTLITL